MVQQKMLNESFCLLVIQSRQTLCDPIDCSLPGSSVHGILQARILNWVAFPCSRKSFQPRDQTWVSCTAGKFFTVWATREMWKTESGPAATGAPAQALLGAAVALLCYVSCNPGTVVHRGQSAEKKQNLLKWEAIWPTRTPNFLTAFRLLPFPVHNYASVSSTLLEVKWGPPCSLKQDAKASSMWDYQFQIMHSHSPCYRLLWGKLLPSLFLKLLETRVFWVLIFWCDVFTVWNCYLYKILPIRLSCGF